ncbi:MAG: permease, partial [Treponemataceae bacterium]|nr:permease [Treponemataceae bacterium]
MLEVIKREAIYLWYYFDIQLRQIVWYWVLGILLGSAISVFAKSRIHQAAEFLGQRVPGIVGLIFASALGIASPRCMYGRIPRGAACSKKGIQ